MHAHARHPHTLHPNKQSLVSLCTLQSMGFEIFVRWLPCEMLREQELDTQVRAHKCAGLRCIRAAVHSLALLRHACAQSAPSDVSACMPLPRAGVSELTHEQDRQWRVQERGLDEVSVCQDARMTRAATAGGTDGQGMGCAVSWRVGELARCGKVRGTHTCTE